MSKVIQIEIYIEGQWYTLGEVQLSMSNIDLGYKSPSLFSYDFDYLDRFGANLLTNGFHAVSLQYPLNFGSIREKYWPSFLLDLIPTGMARENWLKRLNLRDGPAADFSLIENGAINPPGHLRIKTDRNLFQLNTKHHGFSYQEIISRGVDFIEYAEKMGAIVSGTSGAQGVAPKFLLVQDQFENWHGDGSISDDQIHKNWIVKFPRGKKKRDYQILLAESLYYEVARELGIRVLGPLIWDNDALFVPRFDRLLRGQGMIRLGLESFVSALGISEFGAAIYHEDCIACIKRYCSTPKNEIKEYIFRDFLNIVSGNTDNHGRNSAFIKFPDGQIQISPLFDFAPMVLDDSGIARVTRWRNEFTYIPDFQNVAAVMIQSGFTPKEIASFFKDCQFKLENFLAIMNRHGVESEVIEVATRKYDLFMKRLSEFVRIYEKP